MAWCACGIGGIKNLNYFSYGLRLRETFVSVSAVRKQNSVLICFEQRLEVRGSWSIRRHVNVLDPVVHLLLNE